MTLRTHLSNQRGASLVEAMIASAIVLGAVVMMTQGQISVGKTMQKAVKKSYNDKIATNLINTIRNNPKVYQAHFKSYPPEIVSELLKREKLPLAWDKDGVYDLKDCEDCIGRAGFIIVPIATAPGLLELTLRVYSMSRDKKDEYQDYHMIFGAR